MQENIEIFETAFVTADFRASSVELSKDIYAHLWPSGRTQKYRNEYVNNVSLYEPYAHCLRNRFFLDEIEGRHKLGEVEVLINFGCGFSMYPFLLPEGLQHIEIDMPAPISFKREKVMEWQKIGKLPHRNIHFLEADFNTDYQKVLKNEILDIKQDKKSFILLEGVLFFISRDDTNRLFDLFEEIQNKNELVGSVSFQKEIETRKAFKRLAQFTKTRLDANEKFCYQTLEVSYYQNLKKYSIIDHQDTISLSRKYNPSKHLDKEKLLDEHMYILNRI